ncbi:ABC transporter ATP-binding protein [Lujinxingia sediminis]|uniref:ABC transporter ATP-binding protein n=2 Tax=Lujinxingia sediminis TaxID=2480984 RepID=A0ABY0CMN7_9DELT|nr:ABC transporter ATP-binding protein [Lujinxingia sediminis]
MAGVASRCGVGMSQQKRELPALLRLDDVGASVGKRTLFERVSLSVEAGVAWAVVGPNGVGKTTLMRILAGVRTAEQGQVWLHARRLSEYTRREVAREVAVVPQSSSPVFEFSALELVLMGLHASRPRFSLPSSEDRQRALKALARLEVEELANRPVSSLSGGERQRVVMARALVADAPLWLLDEPTANLDLRHQLGLLEVMRQHVEGGGAAVAVLHDLNLVHRYFDRVLLLAPGRALGWGRPDDVLNDEDVSEAFELPMRRVEVEGRQVWLA